MNEVYDFAPAQLSDKDFARLRVALFQAKAQFNVLAKSAADEHDCFSEWIYLRRVKELDEAETLVMRLLEPVLYREVQPIDPVREARLQYLERRLDDEVPF